MGTWLQAHWIAISAIITLLLSAIPVVNRLTTNWSHHADLAMVLDWIAGFLSWANSKGEPTLLKPPFWPEASSASQAMTAKIRTARLSSDHGPLLRCLLPLAIVCGAGLLLASLAGCAHNVAPRRCTHLTAKLMGTSWTSDQCLRAQTKRDLLVGFAAALGALGAGTATAQIPDTDLTRSTGWRVGWSVTTIAAAAGAIVLGYFATTSQKNLGAFCDEYQAPPASRPVALPSDPRPKLLRMRAEVLP